MKKIELEYKFEVDNLIELFDKLSGVKPKCSYVHDEIYGKGGGWKEEKIRKRIFFFDGKTATEFEKTKWIGGKIKKVIEEKLNKIPEEFVLENSYEKIRYWYRRDDCEICVDIYPIGIFCEIEGEKKAIVRMAKQLNFSPKKNISDNIDMFYVKKYGKRINHWRFGKI